MVYISVLLTFWVSDGNIHIDTAFSRLLGKAPNMVAGMTPTTVEVGFVSRCFRGGLPR
jgi:fatty acid synthase subunit alpha